MAGYGKVRLAHCRGVSGARWPRRYVRPRAQTRAVIGNLDDDTVGVELREHFEVPRSAPRVAVQYDVIEGLAHRGHELILYGLALFGSASADERDLYRERDRAHGELSI